MASPGGTVTVGVSTAGDGLPQRVSPSQIATWDSCQLRYYFTTILGWREPATRASTTGVLVHDALEQLYRRPPGERTQAIAEGLLRDRAAAVFDDAQYAAFGKDHTVADSAFRAVRNAFALEDPTAVELTSTDLEAEVLAVFAGVSFGGRIDRRSGGAVPRITDYKTGAKPPPPFLEGKLRQLYLYAAAELASGRPVAEVELLYLGGDGARVRRPVFGDVVADAVTSVVGMRSAAEKALANATFDAKKSSLCAFCAFRRACPQFAVSGPAPGSDESDRVLADRGLVRRRRPAPEPLDQLVDTEDEVQA
jgi:putative RecB family exonuclease